MRAVRQNQSVVGDSTFVTQQELFGHPIHRDAVAGHELDVSLVKPGLRVEWELGFRDLPGQQPGQVQAVVGQARLLGDQRDPNVGRSFPGARRRHDASDAPAHDHHVRS